MIKKAEVDFKSCVACGVCVKACYKSAVSIYKGMYAVIDKDKCVGCGMCKKACPASVIRVVNCSEKMV